MMVMKRGERLTSGQMRKVLADHRDRVGDFSIRCKDPWGGKWRWHKIPTARLLEFFNRRLFCGRTLFFLEERLRGRQGTSQDAAIVLKEIARLEQEASRAARMAKPPHEARHAPGRPAFWFKGLSDAQRREALISELADLESQGRAVRLFCDSFEPAKLMHWIEKGEFLEGTLLHLGYALFTANYSPNAKLAHDDISRLVPPLPKTKEGRPHPARGFQNRLPIADGQPAES